MGEGRRLVPRCVVYYVASVCLVVMCVPTDRATLTRAIAAGALSSRRCDCSQQSSKRSGNVAAGNGRVFAHTGVNPTVEPGLNVPAVAFNASTAAVLWEQPGLVVR